ncbi:MAG: DUF1549 and DUF1553 domain-containing protein [Verrucomicrobiales bacterium]
MPARWMLLVLTPLSLLADNAVRPHDGALAESLRQWWSFRPLAPTQPPVAAAGEGPGRNPIDAFLLRRLERDGRRSEAELNKLALLRRLYLDLSGLPPTPEEIAAFLSDTSQNAYAQAVERLLDSPRYGERAARFWLDLVRYAESDGYKQDAYRSEAWRYRDYVIDSFNSDKPFDRFVQEQLAGDELFPGDPQALIATGFYRCCIYEYNNRDARGQWANILAETTDTVGDVFLGVGMQCARCHDHKFDPILQEDYYRLQACFAGMRWRDDQFAANAVEINSHREKIAAWEHENAQVLRELTEFEREFRERAEREALEKFPRDLEEIFKRGAELWTPYERQLMYIVSRQVREEPGPLDAKMNPEQKRRWKELKNKVADAEKTKPLLPQVFGVGEVAGEKPPTVIAGNSTTVPGGFLTVLGKEEAQGPNHRAALAQWLTRPDHPLTTRVIVNRIWQQHFGRGLVGTPSDLGRLGEEPTDPELLDWLAAEFVKTGWRFKALHRLIVTSAFYRCGGRVADGGLKDGARPVPSAQGPMRLQAEQIRDASLMASGELDVAMHGPAVSSDTGRRTVYTQIKRNTPDPLLASFDAPDTFRSVATRPTTTTPRQSLFLINGQWMQQRAKAMARMLSERHPLQRAEQIQQAFLRALTREPTPRETAEALEFLHTQRQRAAKPSGPASSELAFVESRDLPRHGMCLAITSANVQRGLFPTVRAPEKCEADGFTVEAVVSLRSLWEDASLRTVASRWDGDKARQGWALGVTGKKSRHTPGTLVLQVAGRSAEGVIVYEVAASDLAVPLNRPWFMSAAFDKGKVTFCVKDLGDDDAEMRTATALVPVITVAPEETMMLTLGARSDPSKSHHFDGVIGEARFSARSLNASQLLCLAGGSVDQVVGHWKFEMEGSPLADASPAGRRLEITVQPEVTNPEVTALTDFCHVLLNTSEFLYVD